MGGGASGSANSICSAECIASISLVLVLCILPLSAHVRTNSRDSLYVFPDPFDRAETYFLKGDYELALPIYEHLTYTSSSPLPEYLERYSDCLAFKQNPDITKSIFNLFTAALHRESNGNLEYAVMDYVKIIAREKQAYELPVPSLFPRQGSTLVPNEAFTPKAYNKLLILLKHGPDGAWKASTHLTLAEIFADHPDDSFEAMFHLTEAKDSGSRARISNMNFKLAQSLKERGYIHKATIWFCESLSLFMSSRDSASSSSSQQKDYANSFSDVPFQSSGFRASESGGNVNGMGSNSGSGPLSGSGASGAGKMVSTADQTLSDMLFSIGRAYFGLQHFGTARIALELAAAIDPSNVSAKYLSFTLTAAHSNSNNSNRGYGNQQQPKTYQRAPPVFVEKFFDSLLKESTSARIPSESISSAILLRKAPSSQSVSKAESIILKLIDRYLEGFDLNPSSSANAHDSLSDQSDVVPCSKLSDFDEFGSMSHWAQCKFLPTKILPYFPTPILLPISSIPTALELRRIFLENTNIRPGEAWLDILDLGCGTGAAGLVFRDLADWITGVDVSGASLQYAKFPPDGYASAYNALEKTDILQYLKSANAVRSSSYDVIVLSDVLPSFGGSLQELFQQSFRVLRNGGAILFTFDPIQPTDEHVNATTTTTSSSSSNTGNSQKNGSKLPYIVTKGGFWKHSLQYIEALLNDTRFNIVFRSDVYKPIDSTLYAGSETMGSCIVVNNGLGKVGAQQYIMAIKRS